MKVAFKELPGAGGDDYLRPLIAVSVDGLERAPQLCLLDTGALHNRFAAWVATAAGIDLDDSERQDVMLGGFATVARQATVLLSIGDDSWDAPVWFCDPWPLPFHLLGQEGFFRWFDVRVRAAVYEFEMTAEPGA